MRGEARKLCVDCSYWQVVVLESIQNLLNELSIMTDTHTCFLGSYLSLSGSSLMRILYLGHF